MIYCKFHQRNKLYMCTCELLLNDLIRAELNNNYVVNVLLTLDPLGVSH